MKAAVFTAATTQNGDCKLTAATKDSISSTEAPLNTNNAPSTGSCNAPASTSFPFRPCGFQGFCGLCNTFPRLAMWRNMSQHDDGGSSAQSGPAHRFPFWHARTQHAAKRQNMPQHDGGVEGASRSRVCSCSSHQHQLPFWPCASYYSFVHFYTTLDFSLRPARSNAAAAQQRLRTRPVWLRVWARAGVGITGLRGQLL